MGSIRISLCSVSIILFLLFSANGWSATAQLSIEDLIKIALENNPDIEVARQQYAGREGLLTQARSGYLPQLSAGADYGRTKVEDLRPVDEDNVAHGMLRASQLIYDFGKTTGLIDGVSFDRDASAENLKQTYHDIVFLVKSNFYSVLQYKRLITVAEQAVSNYEQQLYRAQKYYEAGVRARIDVTNAQVNLSNQKLGLLQAKADYQTARVSLEKVIGSIPNSGDYQLVSGEPPLEQLAASKPQLPGPLEELLLTAENNRPGLKRYAYLVQSSESFITQAEGDYWPAIGATGEYNAYDTDLSSLTNQWQIGVGLNWEFFSGFETEGKVAEANAQLREVKAAMREFQLSITEDVTDSYLRADENREGVDIADQTLGLAQENLDLAEGRYKAGIGDVLEFNDAQLLFTENQSSLVVTYYNYLTALARIERAIGVIPELQDYDIAPQ